MTSLAVVLRGYWRFAVAFLLGAVFTSFVWPGQWVYYPQSGRRSALIRVHRITGNAQELTAHGWSSMEPYDPRPQVPPSDLPSSNPYADILR